MSVRTVFIACLSVGALLSGCVTQDPGTAPVAKRLSQLLPMPSPAANPTTPDKVALGARLWIDTRLSGSGTMACTTCHVREKGWTDGLALSRRDNGALNTRHSPTMYNVGYLEPFYWDGRAPTLEAQVLAAWRVQIGADPAKATAAIAAVPAYVAEFQRVFGTAPSQEAIVNALAAYLRAKVSGLSPWERHEMGQAGAVSADARAGFEVFMGKGRCLFCHAPPLYTDGNFTTSAWRRARRRRTLGAAGLPSVPTTCPRSRPPRRARWRFPAPIFMTAVAPRSKKPCATWPQAVAVMPRKVRFWSTPD